MSATATATPEPMVELLRQHLAGSQDDGSDTANPTLGVLGDYLEQRRQQLEADLEREQAEEESRSDEDAALAARRDLIETARAQIGELATELEVLRGRVDLLAAALGACPECWGDDASCRWCRGRGAPGFIPPEPEEFALLVVPAVRMQARLLKLRTNDVDDRRRETEERRSG